MKSILINGASHAGKSETAKEVCIQLKPTKVYKLSAVVANLKDSTLQESSVQNIFNNTFIIQVKNKWILIVAGSPTEQEIQISILIKICIEININISFALVFMRLFERLEDFDTKRELSEMSDIIHSETIYRINNNNFKDTIEWKERIDRIVKLINQNI
ncbi:hypothetical protein [Chryseobacterium sp. MA9]|uniref:hypothetical protein n=1 Tax=Chryseobacterium sp. MA9 TaxID=2966625 RepID=UPI002107CB3F|nr:hypothetical protein [Chryseobacterium sp. MA9]UTX46809.1 hypothetical protein KIK00_12675 [Chryseobacterium sp. MA9]